ncbi:MAG TPA: hypothetical protein VNI58_09730 [Mariprofundaceae bacterium]|nr:hypothetical protein [Mariprofundaceae bacterium]
MNVQLEWPDFRIPPINLWVMPGWGNKSAGLHDLVAGLLAERRRAAGRGKDAEEQAGSSNNTHELNQTRQLHRQLLAIRGGNHGNEN